MFEILVPLRKLILGETPLSNTVGCKIKMKKEWAILTMGLLTFLFGCKVTNDRYIDEPKFKEIMTKQTAMAPEALNQLNRLGVNSYTQLKIEYFFYTNTIDKASALAEVMEKKGYSVEYKPSAYDSKTYVITGWTNKMSMEKTNVIKWSRLMCQIGYDYDCEFDGWGTAPGQD